MPTPFRHHDSLRLFARIARHSSLSDAAQALHMTKGAISYQIRVLEGDLGLSLFQRHARGVTLTRQGEALLSACEDRYAEIETAINGLKGPQEQTLTVGVSSYFAARWLSPRLMGFMQDHPDIQLRIQPMIRLFDLTAQGVDMAIRWGNGAWRDAQITPFLPVPAFPVGNAHMRDLVARLGMASAIRQATLLRDHDDSNAWTDWLTAAGLVHQTRRDTLIVPDPNVRVQSVIDGQGIALMDRLIDRELDDGRLFRLSEVTLSDYGYFIARPGRSGDPQAVAAFTDWLLAARRS